MADLHSFKVGDRVRFHKGWKPALTSKGISDNMAYQGKVIALQPPMIVVEWDEPNRETSPVEQGVHHSSLVLEPTTDGE